MLRHFISASLLIAIFTFSVAAQSRKSTVTITPVTPDVDSRDTVIHLNSKPQPIIGVNKVLQYPDSAKRAGIEGSVTVRFKVLRSCKTDSVTVVKSDNPLLADAAVEAIKKCKYLPAIKDKKIVETWTIERVTFKLH